MESDIIKVNESKIYSNLETILASPIKMLNTKNYIVLRWTLTLSLGQSTDNVYLLLVLSFLGFICVQGGKELLQTPIVNARSFEVNQVTGLQYALKWCIFSKLPVIILFKIILVCATLRL